MPKTILLSGYIKQKNVARIRSFFPGEDIILACAYIRQPLSEAKQTYLQLFDEVYDLSTAEDVARLQKNADTISCITCTQERDMVAYIQTLLLCKKITAEQSASYTAAINKHTFKESLGEKCPELVPSHHVITPELLENLDTLSYPQVIKPSGLAGGIMIRIVYSPEEFKEHYENFSEKMHTIASEHYAKKVDIITESFVEGSQYSINTYINAEGVITFCPIVRVITPQEIGIDDTYSVFQYTTDELSDDEVTALQAAVGKITAHFDIKNTSAHFDAVLSNGQWQFFEVGLRYGGHRQRLYELSHYIDTFRNDIYNRLGVNIIIPEQQKNACILQKCATEHGILSKISYTRVIQEEKSPLIIEGKLGKIGSEVMPLSLGGGTITRHYVVGTELTQVLAASRELFDAIDFQLT